MKNVFVKTSNYERFRTGITTVEDRGAAEASLMLVTGEAGYGKSETVDHWAIQNGAAYLRAKVEWTPRYFMAELAEHLKIDSRGRAKDIFARISGYIGMQQTPLVIDEVEHCLRDGAQVLEAIRDLSDLTEVLVILVGMEQVQAKIARHAQISSRIAKVVEFHPSTIDDVALACRQLAEVEILPELIMEIHRQSGGPYARNHECDRDLRTHRKAQRYRQDRPAGNGRPNPYPRLASKTAARRKGGAVMQYHPIDDSHLVFPVGGERGAQGSLILGVWRYDERRLRTVQLSLVVAGRGAVDLEMTAAGAQRFAEELDSHARSIIALNEEGR